MDSDLVIIIFVVAVVIIGGYGYAWLMKKKRREAMQALADQWMWTYSEESDALLGQLESFYLKSRGRQHKVLNLMSGRDGNLDVQLFEYVHVTGHGRSRREHLETVALIASSRLSLPMFTIRPKGSFEFFRKRFGKSAIEFSNDPKFDGEYLVFSAENATPEPVRDVVTMNARQHLTSRKMIVEGNRDRLLVYRERKHVKSANMRAFLDEAKAVFEQFSSAEDMRWS